jgi:hypothetical protein
VRNGAAGGARRDIASSELPSGVSTVRKLALSVYMMAATFTLAACGNTVSPTPTDEELRRFTTRLDADARRDIEAALSEARRGEADRARTAEARREQSARERRNQQAE